MNFIFQSVFTTSHPHISMNEVNVSLKQSSSQVWGLVMKQLPRIGIQLYTHVSVCVFVRVGEWVCVWKVLQKEIWTRAREIWSKQNSLSFFLSHVTTYAYVSSYFSLFLCLPTLSISFSPLSLSEETRNWVTVLVGHQVCFYMHSSFTTWLDWK